VPVASRSVGVEPAAPAGVRMKARTTSTQPRSGNQTGHAAQFIDSIDPKQTLADEASGPRSVRSAPCRTLAEPTPIGSAIDMAWSIVMSNGPCPTSPDMTKHNKAGLSAYILGF